MSAEGPSITGSGDVPTVLVRDGQNRQLLCFLEQLIPLDGHDYALLTPVDTPVCLVRIAEGDDEEDEVVEEVDGPTDNGRCVVADRQCAADEPCVLHVAWARARVELRSSLAGLTLAALAGEC